jgi:hypothetical protein
MKLGQDCYIVRDATGQQLAYVYFEDEPGRRSAAHLMTRDGGASRRISRSCRSCYAKDASRQGRMRHEKKIAAIRVGTLHATCWGAGPNCLTSLPNSIGCLATWHSLLV